MDNFAAADLFAKAFLIALSGALMPGPLLAVTISQAVGRGTRAGPLIVAGHALAELALVSAVALGLGALLRPPSVTAAIGLVGGVVLLWMGLAMIRGSKHAAASALHSLHGRQSGDTPDCAGSALRCVALGAVVSVSNPYWTIWWITIGLALLTKALSIGGLAVGAFYLGHILADLVWYWAVAFIAARGAAWLNTKIYRGLLIALAFILIWFGLLFALGGTSTLLNRG